MTRRMVADYLGCNPNEPDSWPNEAIDRLMAVYEEEGREEFLYQVSKLMRR